MNAQLVAVKVLIQINKGSNINSAIDQACSGLLLSQADNGALRDITYGCQRYFFHLKFWLKRLIKTNISDENVVWLLYVALYQLAYTRNACYAVVYNAVNVSSRFSRGKYRKLVNAILRNFLRQKERLFTELDEQTDDVKYNHPEWWIDKIRKDYPDIYGDILSVNNQHPPMTLRVNLRRLTVQSYFIQLVNAGFDCTLLGGSAIQLKNPVPVNKLPGFFDGLCSVQDYGAQKSLDYLKLLPNLLVLDAFAAPGGKACHMLETENINLTVVDSSADRLFKVRENLKRLSLSAEVFCSDIRDSQQWCHGTLFDRILADVPCSASGVVRRNPDIKWQRREEDISHFSEQQAIFLQKLWPFLSRGGILLYATCSIFKEENRDQIRHFLSKNHDAILNEEVQLFPNDQHDGFYYAQLEKI